MVYNTGLLASFASHLYAQFGTIKTTIIYIICSRSYVPCLIIPYHSLKDKITGRQYKDKNQYLSTFQTCKFNGVDVAQ